MRSPPPKQSPIDQMVAQGLQAHVAGRVAEARQRYESVLRIAARHPQANHLMGVLLLQSGAVDAAIPHLSLAAEQRPADAAFRSNLGVALKRLGRLDEAEREFRAAVAVDPRSADAQFNLANLLVGAERWQDALAPLEAVTALRPRDIDPWLELSRVCLNLGLTERAVAALEHLLREHPRHVGALTNLGVALGRLGRHAEAVATLERARAIAPDATDVLSNLGSQLQDVDRYPDSIAVLEHCLRIDPNHGNALHNLAMSLRAENRGVEALAASRRAVALLPAQADARTGLGFELLMQGQLEEGFKEYEWRVRMADFPSPKRDFPLPPWTDQPLAGLKLLVHDEQGVGDAIQFIRYAKLLKQAGATVFVECNTQLSRLFRSAHHVDGVVPRATALPEVDAYVPLLSLPHKLGTTPDSIPAHVPYIDAEPALVAQWAARLGPRTGRLRVGLVWSGNPEFKADRLRSPGLRHVLPLLAVPGVEVYALQKGPGRKDLEVLGTPPGLVDLGPEIGDFADTAAIMANLDLVISSCTGPAHLAGALGVKTWVMLPFAPDWRWMRDRTDSPWYPTVRLFRQPGRDRWPELVAEVAGALAAASLSHRPAEAMG